MSRGPRRRRFKFNCGHLGQGAYCHRCRQAQVLLEKHGINEESSRLLRTDAENDRLKAEKHAAEASAKAAIAAAANHAANRAMRDDRIMRGEES